MKTFYIIFRLILVMNFIACIIFIDDDSLDPVVHIALVYYAILLVFTFIGVQRIISDSKASQRIIREMNKD